MKAVGAIFILWFISPTIIAFLYWQIFLSCLQLFFFEGICGNTFPWQKASPALTRKLSVRSGRYAMGITGITVLTVILMQADKVILSKLVTLTDFGYYTLAATVAGALSMVLYPVTAAVFPRITELLSKENQINFWNCFIHPVS